MRTVILTGDRRSGPALRRLPDRPTDRTGPPPLLAAGPSRPTTRRRGPRERANVLATCTRARAVLSLQSAGSAARATRSRAGQAGGRRPRCRRGLGSRCAIPIGIGSRSLRLSRAYRARHANGSRLLPAGAPELGCRRDRCTTRRRARIRGRLDRDGGRVRAASLAEPRVHVTCASWTGLCDGATLAATRRFRDVTAARRAVRKGVR